MQKTNEQLLKEYLDSGNKITELSINAKSKHDLGRGAESSKRSIDRLYKQVHKSKAYGRMKANKT